MVAEGYTIFAVEGALPQADPSAGAAESGRWWSEEEIEAAAISPGLDWYSTTTRHPVTKRTMPFALPVSGDAILEGSVSKKNRRSLGFYMCIDSIALIPATIGNLGQWHDGQEQVAREDGRDDDEDHGDDDDGDMDEDAWPYGRRS